MSTTVITLVDGPLAGRKYQIDPDDIGLFARDVTGIVQHYDAQTGRWLGVRGEE